MSQKEYSDLEIYFSDVFDVDPAVVTGYGAFDISLVNDLPLFVDPFLLFNSPKKEYQALHDEIIRYMRFLKSVSIDEDIAPGLVDAWFTFPEVRQNWLGWSETGNRGHGLGRDFAKALNRNLGTVFRNFGEETISKSSHLEKLCLIRDGIGRDNVSDFTVNLIKGFIANYTQEFAREHINPSSHAIHRLDKVRFNYETRSWVSEEFDLPSFEDEFVLLTPRDMLTKDETWINRKEFIDRFSAIADALPNTTLRAQVSQYLLRMIPSGPKVTDKEVSAAMAAAVEQFPELIDYYIRQKEDNGDKASDLSKQRVENVERRFVAAVRQLAALLESEGFYSVAGSTHDEAMKRVTFLRDVVENKGGHKLFYVDGQAIERETDLHIMYRLTWFATLSDVSREVNDGRGPADFKISRGAPDKTIVEFKLAKNTHLESNLQKQAEIYTKASDGTHPPIKVIVYFSDAEKARVDVILKRLALAGNPNIVLIDARSDNKPSASKA